MITWHSPTTGDDKQNHDHKAEDRRTVQKSSEKHNPVLRHLRAQQALLDTTLIHWDYRVQSQADALELEEMESD
jgi:hypothetical protein